MTRNQNLNDDDDASSRKKRFTTCDNGGVAPWLELNHDLLYLVMMQLGVIDFVAFSGVCKSWRSLALDNRKIFMASRPPMQMWISNHEYTKELYCCMEDFEGRNFKTILPHSIERTCVGLTCGYLILLGEETKDFWLVNPITRHQLHFPCIPFDDPPFANRVRAILVFSRSINGWVFVVLNQSGRKIWFSISGKGTWNHVSSSFRILDLHAFKGKIYTIDSYGVVCDLILSPNPKLTWLKIKNFPQPRFLYPGFVSWDENLYVLDIFLEDSDMVQVLDLDEMKWVTQKERTIGEFAFFLSFWRYDAATKPESWAVDPLSHYKRYERILDTSDKRPKHMFFAADKWYFPNRCLNVDHINE